MQVCVCARERMHMCALHVDLNDQGTILIILTESGFVYLTRSVVYSAKKIPTNRKRPRASLHLDQPAIEARGSARSHRLPISGFVHGQKRIGSAPMQEDTSRGH